MIGHIPMSEQSGIDLAVSIFAKFDYKSAKEIVQLVRTAVNINTAYGLRTDSNLYKISAIDTAKKLVEIL